MSVSIPVTSVELEAEHTKYPTMHAGCIAEIKRLREEVKGLKAELRDDAENRRHYEHLTRAHL